MYHIQKTTTTTTKTAFPRVWTLLAKNANAELTFLALDLDQGNADLIPTQCTTSSDHAALRDEGVINTTACTYTPISLSCQVMTEWVPPEHREIHDLLINWGRWAITPRSQAHCASIEHRFKSPQCWNNPEPKTEHNEQLAFLIERSMRIIPKLSRKLLKLKYVLKADKQFISKHVGDNGKSGSFPNSATQRTRLSKGGVNTDLGGGATSGAPQQVRAGKANDGNPGRQSSAGRSKAAIQRG